MVLGELNSPLSSGPRVLALRASGVRRQEREHPRIPQEALIIQDVYSLCLLPRTPPVHSPILPKCTLQGKCVDTWQLADGQHQPENVGASPHKMLEEKNVYG